MILKNLLMHFDSYKRFAYSHDLGRDIFLNKNWADEREWEKLNASYNIHWENSAIDPWMDYYPGVWMPIDHIEEAEKRKSQDVQRINGDKRWGLEIGIRYFPDKEYLPPVFLHEVVAFYPELLNEKSIIRGKETFKYLHMFELLLAGYPRFLLRKHKNMHKHWLYNNIEDKILLQTYEKKGIKWTDIKWFARKGKFNKLLRYSAQIDSKILNLSRKTDRYMRWQQLKIYRDAQMSNKLNKINFFVMFIKLLLDIVTGKIQKK